MHYTLHILNHVKTLSEFLKVPTDGTYMSNGGISLKHLPNPKSVMCLLRIEGHYKKNHNSRLVEEIVVFLWWRRRESNFLAL